ncbi:uncharacterized protein LOC106094722 [Stomoxys calcitrans]|uniref:Uncharacterized protein n=1 Tax=Stomoxys calcitrans TaxID=35570 RepID=A0A1I8PDI6_STOCA|nr:uncharacterized protein LOC106094722 [Stomoxys calcitrans]XP_059221982.1 uncharacterized protein LOC106094722 [Stomoxys calcitrans]
MQFYTDFKQLSHFVMNFCVIQINELLQNLFHAIYLDFQIFFNIK